MLCHGAAHKFKSLITLSQKIISCLFSLANWHKRYDLSKSICHIYILEETEKNSALKGSDNTSINHNLCT